MARVLWLLAYAAPPPPDIPQPAGWLYAAIPPRWWRSRPQADANGSTLDPLLAKMGWGPRERWDHIVVHGFSEGFQAVRYLIRSAYDLATIDTVMVGDSLHFPRRPPARSARDSQALVPDPAALPHYDQLVAPFVRAAVRAMLGAGLYVTHWAPNIPGPLTAGQYLTSSAAGNRAVFAQAERSVGRKQLEQPPAVPTDHHQLVLGANAPNPPEPYPVPTHIYGHANAIGLTYPPLRDLRAAHIQQGDVRRGVVVADVYRGIVCPRFGVRSTLDPRRV